MRQEMRRASDEKDDLSWLKGIRWDRERESHSSPIGCIRFSPLIII
jgi:hypothetical protein